MNKKRNVIPPIGLITFQFFTISEVVEINAINQPEARITKI
jgi:hypothetical protein